MSQQPSEDDRPAEPTPLGDDVLDEFGDGELPTVIEAPAGTIGFTHFDAPGSEDDQLVVLIPREQMESVTAGMMVRIESAPDVRAHAEARTFQGVVVAGPFAEPSGLKVESTVVVATTLGGKARVLLPRYHGRAIVQVTAEVIEGRSMPPRRRPRPNSPIVPLSDAETTAALQISGNLLLGKVLGNEAIDVCMSTESKNQFPRHLGILGTTGGGKSNTVAGLVGELQRQDASVVLLDVEGEYVDMDQPADDPAMLAALADQGLTPRGVEQLRVMHPVGRETNRDDGDAHPFCLRFEDLSPYAVMDVLDLTDAQQQRFLKAYDALKLLMKDLGIFPRPGHDGDRDLLLNLDELDRGYPRMTLAMLRDVVNVCLDYADRGESGGGRRSASGGDDVQLSRPLYAPALKGEEKRVRQVVARARVPGHYVSWMALLGKLNRIARLGVFDSRDATPIDPADLTRPGRVTILDLSDTDSPVVNNLVIASVLRQVQRQQEADFDAARAAGGKPSPTVVVIEEAHEFLSSTRLKQQPHLFDQVARIAKRGRKRWLGLTFVTQLPQHLPDEVLGLINNYILHAIRDPQVVQRLSRQIPGLQKNQWSRVPSLAPGQAVVSLTTAARPVLAQVNPAACRLRFVE